MITKESFDEVESKTDIVSLIGEYVSLTQYGNGWIGFCPFHHEKINNKKKPSFVINVDKKYYYCFACYDAGNVFKFVQGIEKVSFDESVEILAKRVGVQVKYVGSETFDQHRKVSDLDKTNTEESKKFITNESIDEVKSKTDIVSLIGEYVSLTQYGNGWIGFCPFHHGKINNKKKPSFAINGDKKYYYCFACHEAGNVFKFVQGIEKVSFRESVEILAKRVGVQVKYVGSETFDQHRKVSDLDKTNTEDINSCISSESIGEVESEKIE